MNYLYYDVIIKYYLCFVCIDLFEMKFHIICFIYLCKCGFKIRSGVCQQCPILHLLMRQSCPILHHLEKKILC
jgi:hypothetical protein